MEAQKLPVTRRDLLDAAEISLAYWTKRRSCAENEATNIAASLSRTQIQD